METRPRSRSVLVAAPLAFAALPFAVEAQSDVASYPSKPIRIIVPFSPQGPNDLLARLVGQKLNEAWKQPVVVENRPGAGTIIGTEVAARSPGDGHTLLMVSTSTAVNPTLRKSLPYDTLRDFTPVVRIAESPNVLVVHPSVPVRSVRDLIKLAQANPGAVAYASGGAGAATHLAGELLATMGKVSMTHVPYKGAGPATVDLLGGQVSWMFGTILPTIPHIEARKLRAIAVSGLRRTPALPDVPTVAETLPGFDATSWYGLFAPSATPGEIVARINAQVVKALEAPDLREHLRRQGVDPVGDSPEEFARNFRNEISKWGEVIRSAGLKPN